MGPTCWIILDDEVTEELLEMIDRHLGQVVVNLNRTRKGRHWSGRIDERPIDIAVDREAAEEPIAIWFAAGCNAPEDYRMLRSLSRAVAKLVGGVATKPRK